MFKRFFDWYNRHHTFQLRLATTLFVLQLVHLIWMTTNVIAFRLWGVALFPKFLDPLLAIIDYTEIPALIMVTVVYLNDVVQGHKTKRAWWFIFLLNTQWIHLFWITDEIILANFQGVAPIILPVWLSWIAILIDYLELPVMFDTVRRSLSKQKLPLAETVGE